MQAIRVIFSGNQPEEYCCCFMRLFGVFIFRIICTMNYYSHPTAVIDEGCLIGTGTKIWHFSHIMSGCEIGEKPISVRT